MKKILLIIAIAISTNIYAQKGSSQFSLFGGFEHFPELKCRNGYNVGVEFKHYLNNRVYALANFHAGVNDGTKNVSYTRDEIDYNLKSATKLFSVLLASKRPLITELADKLRLKYPLLPTISPCPTMRLEAIRSIIPISCRRYPKSV